MDFHKDETRMALSRNIMVDAQIMGRGVQDSRVLHAMRHVPRHRFVPEDLMLQAYADNPLPIGFGQTISQPYIVAYMAEALQLKGYERVLEIGSGSGYMAAVLSLLVKDVYALELEPELHARSQSILQDLGFENLHLRCGDGAKGWPEKAPFDAVILSCAADGVPPALWEQMSLEGRMILPLGSPYGFQQLVLMTKALGSPHVQPLLPVSFVPLR